MRHQRGGRSPLSCQSGTTGTRALSCARRSRRRARAVLVPVCTGKVVASRDVATKKQPYTLCKAVSGAPSAGALRKRSSGTFLATGPREANASACATHEPAPKGMVQPPFRPIRLWRDLCSKMVHCTVFARRYARRRGLTGCGARIGQRPLGGTSPLRPWPLLRLPVSAAGGGRLRGCSRPRWCTDCRGIPDYSNKKAALHTV